MATLVSGLTIEHVLGLPFDLISEFWEIVQSFVPPLKVVVWLGVQARKPQVDHFLVLWTGGVSDWQLSLELVCRQGHDYVSVFGPDEETQEQSIVGKVCRPVAVPFWFVIYDYNTLDQSFFGHSRLFPVIASPTLPIYQQQRIGISLTSLGENGRGIVLAASIKRSGLDDTHFEHFEIRQVFIVRESIQSYFKSKALLTVLLTADF